MRLVVISGRSGSGKTSALNILEDVGFTCIDNLPVSLLPELIRQLDTGRGFEGLQIAVGIDARNLSGDLSATPEILDSIESNKVSVRVIYLDARDADLIKRYSETRRKHPLSSDKVNLKQAIELDKSILAPIADAADRKVDTSGLTLHQLRDLIKNIVVPDKGNHMAILFESFGFKRGVPVDADFVFDVRCLPNPHWKHELRALTGNDVAVIGFLETQVEVARMLADIITFLSRWIPSFQANNRSYLTIAIGCTGGQHRSVYLANRLSEYFSAEYPSVQVVHKELSA